MASQGEAPILITATVKGKQISQSIFCTADTYYGALIQDSEHLIINENFSTYETGAVLEQWSGNWGTADVYGSCNGKGTPASSYNEANNVTIVTEENNNNNNRAQMNDTTGGGTEVIVDFGAVDGVVKGYANIKFIEYGGSWTFAQIYGKDTGKPTGGEILALRSTSSYLKVRVNGVEQDALVNNIAPKTGDNLRLYYEIDLKNDTAVIYVNGIEFYESAGALGISELWGLKFTSSDNGSKRVSLDNIAVTHVGVSAQEHKADLLAKLDTEYAKYAEADYNADKWTTLSAAYNTAKTEINGATDKAVMNAAYDTAVAAMKAVPTKVGEELYNAKEAYKAEIAEAYPAASYTYNATAYETAKAAVITAIDNYNGEVAGLKTDAIIVAKVAVLAAVKNDTDAMTEAKTAYKAEIAETYPTGSYTINATDYQAKYNAVIDAIDNYSGAIADIKTDTTIAGLIETLAAVKTDAQELTAAKTAAIEEINNYAATQKTEVDKTTATEAEKTKAKADIDTTVNLRTTAINSASRIEQVNEEVATAKTNIDSYVAALTETLDQVKAREKATLEATYNEIKADITDTVVLNILAEDYAAAVAKIDAAGDKARVAELRAEATNGMRVRVARREAYVAITEYATTVKSDLYSESAKTAIDEEVKYDISTLTDQSKWSADMWVIHNATTIVGVEAAKQTVLDKIDEIAEEAKNATFNVTLGTTGETLTVKYGTEVKLGDLFVTAYNVTAAEYSGTAITADAGVTVYDDITIDVTLAEIEGFAPSADWRVAAEATDVANIVNNSLVSVTSNGGEVYTNGSFSIAGKSFTRWWTSANIVSPTDKNTGEVNEIHDNKATPLVIKAKQTLKSLTVYVTLADSAGTGNNRHGTIYAVINGGEPIAIKTLTSKGDMSVAWKPEGIKAGDLIEIYAVNENASGARLHLFGIDAAIDESKVEQTVHVTWKGAGDGGADLTENYRYYEKITAPNYNATGNEIFDFWHIKGNEAEEWTDGVSLSSGSYVYVAKTHEGAAISSVTLEAAATELEIGSSLELTVTATDTNGADGLTGREVSWTVTGNAEVKLVEGKYVLSLTEGAAAGDTVMVKATVGGVDSEVKSIMVKAALQEGWKKDFSVGAPSSNLSYKSGDKIDADKTATGGGTFVGAIEVTDSTSSKCNWNKAGYFKGSENAVISITTNAAASLIIADANSNSARSYTVKDSTGKVIKTHTMNNGSETITLAAAGTYTISFAGGECRIKSIELKP